MIARLIIFTRYPEAGRSKTRLIPALGADGAAELHREMVAHTLRWSRQLKDLGECQLVVRFTGGDECRMKDCFGANLAYEPQGDGDLGQRLVRASREAFDAGVDRVVLIGTDCPELNARLTGEAIELLTDHDVVLGPASDGGYYLIGFRQQHAALFEGISWSTEVVLEQTLRTVLRLNLSVALLPTLDDVDRPEDIAVWKRITSREQSADSPVAEALSVIVPTWNDEPLLDAALQSVMRVTEPTGVQGASEPDGNNDLRCLNSIEERPAADEFVPVRRTSSPSSSSTDGLEVRRTEIECIIVAAGRVESSLQSAVRHRCRFLMSAPGRGRQLNLGVRYATGASLLFLHADTLLPDGYAAEIASLLSSNKITGGAFSLAINAPQRAFRLIECGVAYRSRWRQMPYGDQGLFVRRDVFDSIGGFNELPLMEDYDFVRRLRAKGRLGISPLRALTSARRWQKLGVIRTTLLNQLIITGYHCGISIETLARWYRG